MNFDDADRLNADGTVTLTLIPSNWRAFNLSPDTYQTCNGDSWCEGTIEYFAEEAGRDLVYDDLKWTYDHAGIVRSLSEVLAEWLSEKLMEAGLESLQDVRVIDSWSPKFYNFESDGFEVELTCDPDELRSLTETFSLGDWVTAHYGSVSGFRSFVPGRLKDDDWRAQYDGEFRLESLLLTQEDKYGALRDSALYALIEAEWDVYERHVEVELIHPEFMDSGHTLPELEAWAAEVSPYGDPEVQHDGDLLTV